MKEAYILASLIRTKHKVSGRKRVGEFFGQNPMPIQVKPLGDGTYTIQDGRNRFEAMTEQGFLMIPCEIVK